MQWFDVDKAGLAKLLERRGKQFILYELLQNAWDEKSTHVELELSRISNSPYVEITVTDDNPDGFADLTHAFTLFAESNKKGDAEKRGRFNLGEKLVLAMCRCAEIKSTTGSIVFNEHGRTRNSLKTEHGSRFTGQLKMTNEEIHECWDHLHLLIPPAHIDTFCKLWVNGTVLARSLTSPEAVCEVSGQNLPTEIADTEGILRRTSRKTTISIHKAAKQAYLYEMGIPVVEIDDVA